MRWTIDESSPSPLHEQIASCVLRSLEDGELVPGARLPTATELAGVLGVNPNTVLHAYRGLRDRGVLEFRRGRGARVSPDAVARGRVAEAVRGLVELGRAYGYSPRALAALVEEMG